MAGAASGAQAAEAHSRDKAQEALEVPPMIPADQTTALIRS